MQGTHTYIPETNYIPREYSVTAILLLLFMVLKSLVSVLYLLYFYISTFRRIYVLLLLLLSMYMQGNYIYVPKKKPYIAGYPLQCCSHSVPTVCRHALTFPMLNALYLYMYISTLCSGVQCTIWLSSGSSLISLLRYCLNDCQMVPVAPNITGVTSVLHSTKYLLLSLSSSSSTCCVT